MTNIKNEPMLPVGDRPFWDLNGQDDEIESISESCVLLKSLRQSRERWLSQTFPKFSTKTRGNKAPEVTPPPHTIQTRGRCSLEIGPHLFPDTIVYEVHYLSSPVSYTPTPPAQTTSNPYWAPSVSYTSSYRYTPATTQATQPVNNPVTTQAPATTSTPAPEASADTVPAPLISSLTTHVAAITPNLINQVNAAASANPILSNLLQLAAAGNATPDQLKTLGLLIQSLANIENVSSIPSSATPQQISTSQSTSGTNYYNRLPSPVKPFDVVFEFRETPSDRLVFPRGLVHAERLCNSTNTNTDILLHMALSNAGPLSSEFLQQTNDGTGGRYPVTLHLNQASPAIWDTVSRWIGGDEQNLSNKIELEKLVPSKRLYLGLQLQPGPLLTQLQTACGSPYAMKPLKQGPTPQSRTNRQRKPYTQKKITEQNPNQNKPDDPVPVKKSRTSQSKASPTPIQCLTCKQTDVPLILGGRYCRPCVDAGKWTPVVTPLATSQPPPTSSNVSLPQ
ncbi:hypothetical protein M413DRAFT_439447 [Hebeloma cylindrosporum]|uniref:Uncharacterized protein n=1 Tax=Hebeloma cylindrosporum TaxID=76867 RepID=A0A0C2Z3F8_HEBCY|nr:hypothetical protein M413DRAFT_439447 [Hebeloma cylindrosporum h7]